jgi:acetyl-CoA carboxylase biotin carboxylase subunit
VFRKILIANRGEIAVRIARACSELGIESVAVYSDADRDAPHTRVTDHALHIGPAPSTESYLSSEALLGAARQASADAVHPGYGFLSENADFARAVENSGLTFIGPPASAIAAMGDKTRARATVAAVGVPVVPALDDPPPEAEALRGAARSLGYPLLVKAAAGGGGKGMRVVRVEADLLDAFAAAQREAESAFGDGRLFLERYFERPRHVEIQVLADRHGHLVHLGERECSVQRRYQKIVEESPSPAVDGRLRNRLAEAALAAARSVGYSNAGTVEFLLNPDGSFYFLEMNTRLQVEHPVTEWVTGFDLVEAQIRIAAGEPLQVEQGRLTPRGHAIECRIYGEDPDHQFLPSPGRIVAYAEPSGPGVRVDSGVRAGLEVPVHYDPMLAKVSVWGADREAACRRMIASLRRFVVLGPTTNVSFLIDVVDHPDFAAGRTHTHFIEQHLHPWHASSNEAHTAAVAAALHATLAPRATAGGATREHAVASPWETLGHWRLGAADGER